MEGAKTIQPMHINKPKVKRTKRKSYSHTLDEQRLHFINDITQSHVKIKEV